MHYSITIKDAFNNTPLTGTFEAPTEAEAIAQAKEHYALELDTIPEAIEIINIKDANPF